MDPIASGSKRGIMGAICNRKWPIAMTVAVVVSGMAFMLFWIPLNQHRSGWDTGGDMWGIFRAAHYIAWGFIGGVYDPTTGVLSLPGIEVILAPVAALSSHLGLSESFPPFYAPHPAAALLVVPIELLLASTVLFAVDALAEQLGVLKGRRVSLCIATAVIAWPTAAVWGHAEDCLALALLIYALMAGLKSKWTACGWLFGFALVTQPLVVMVLPLVVAASPQGKRLVMAVRAVALSVALAAVAFASDAANAYRALVQQPTPPSINHATPWVSLAPRVFSGIPKTGESAGLSFHNGKFVQTSTYVHSRAPILVSGGAGRAVEVVIAVLVGLYVWRRPQSPDRLIWLAAACLGMRCMFEAVMTPYYLAPPLILALAIASRQGNKRFFAACVIALETTIFAYHHLNPWVWWLPVVAGMAAVLALGYPVHGSVADPLLTADLEAEDPDLPEEPAALLEVPTTADAELQPVS